MPVGSRHECLSPQACHTVHVHPSMVWPAGGAASCAALANPAAKRRTQLPSTARTPAPPPPQPTAQTRCALAAQQRTCFSDTHCFSLPIVMARSRSILRSRSSSLATSSARARSALVPRQHRCHVSTWPPAGIPGLAPGCAIRRSRQQHIWCRPGAAAVQRRGSCRPTVVPLLALLLLLLPRARLPPLRLLLLLARPVKLLPNLALPDEAPDAGLAAICWAGKRGRGAVGVDAWCRHHA